MGMIRALDMKVGDLVLIQDSDVSKLGTKQPIRVKTVTHQVSNESSDEYVQYEDRDASSISLT